MRRDEKILVVEDNPTICQAIEEAGARLDISCDCASDGWEAIEKLELEDYAAIFIDTDVPRHSGFGVLTYLREEVGDDLANVILLTSATDHDDLRRRVGADLRVVAKGDAVAEVTRVFGKA
ncbi:MAG TPA: response regulator [Thermoanaerobaculia bacterium]